MYGRAQPIHSITYLSKRSKGTDARTGRGKVGGRFRGGLLHKCRTLVYQPLVKRKRCYNARRVVDTLGSVGLSKTMGSKQGVDFSDVAKIEEEPDNPVELFRIWRDEARKYNPRAPDACCLATVSKNCEVSARNVVLREFDNDGFVIVTDKRSKKVHDIESVPQAAMCYMWFYVNEKEQEITRQVRVEGTMIRLKKEEFQHLYDREPLYCKVRAHLCHQGHEVNWEELKQRHDEILDSVRRNDNGLPMPDHFIGYKLLPTMIEFYFARDQLIGDRLLYSKDASSGSWQHHRIAA